MNQDKQLREMPLWELVEHYGKCFYDRHRNFSYSKYFKFVESILRERIEELEREK